jgi:glycosyltransferase involved in cell wall biosynthesis
MLNREVAMSGHPSVDVVIAAYNAQDHIAETLDSLAAQTCPPQRIIVTDDGSADATAAIVGRWANNNSVPLTLLRQPNQGPSSARNAALRSSSADLIALLDADDIAAPDALAALSASFRHIADLVLSFGDTTQFNSRGIVTSSFLRGKQVESEPFYSHACGARIFKQPLLQGLAFGNYIPPSASMFSRQAALGCGLFDTSLVTSEDLDFFMRLTRQGKVAYYPKPLAMRRRHENNLTSPANSVMLSSNRVRVLNKMLRLAVDLHLTPSEIEAAKRGRAVAASDLLYNASLAGWLTYSRHYAALVRTGAMNPARGWRHFARMMAASSGILPAWQRMRRQTASRRRANAPL